VELKDELDSAELDELPVVCASAVERDTNPRLPARKMDVALFNIKREWKKVPACQG
jgi:hypothetical protein